MSDSEIEPLDTLLAIKTILLAPGFSPSERRAFGALVEHLSRETGQCDPSVPRLAGLLDLSERQVERAVEGLAGKGVIRFFRHGGRSNRNQHEITWERVAELHRQWQLRFNASADARATKMSSTRRHSRRDKGDTNVNQTYLKNLQNRTYSQPGRKEKQVPSTPSQDAARSQAERRIDEELRRILHPVAVYTAAYTSIGDAVWGEAIDSEVRCRGTGAAVLVRHLKARATLTAENSAGTSSTGPSSALRDAEDSDPDDSPVSDPKTRVDGG